MNPLEQYPDADIHNIPSSFGQNQKNARTAKVRAEGVRALSAFMLVAVVLASLAFGVLVAYGICLAFFTIAREHSMATARQREVCATQPKVTIIA